jgi:hypothetical protein
MTTLIKSGRVVTAVDDYVYVADIFIDGETVTTARRAQPTFYPLWIMGPFPCFFDRNLLIIFEKRLFVVTDTRPLTYQ